MKHTIESILHLKLLAKSRKSADRYLKHEPNSCESLTKTLVCEGVLGLVMHTRRPLSSSFLRFIFRILQGSPKKELLRAYE